MTVEKLKPKLRALPPPVLVGDPVLLPYESPEVEHARLAESIVLIDTLRDDNARLRLRVSELELQLSRHRLVQRVEHLGTIDQLPQMGEL